MDASTPHPTFASVLHLRIMLNEEPRALTSGPGACAYSCRLPSKPCFEGSLLTLAHAPSL
mgnify:CR=1 FL=1